MTAEPKEAAARLQRTLSLVVEKARGVTPLEVLGALDIVRARVMIETFGIVTDQDLEECAGGVTD